MCAWSTVHNRLWLCCPVWLPRGTKLRETILLASLGIRAHWWKGSVLEWLARVADYGAGVRPICKAFWCRVRVDGTRVETTEWAGSDGVKKMDSKAGWQIDAWLLAPGSQDNMSACYILLSVRRFASTDRLDSTPVSTRRTYGGRLVWRM